MNIYKVTRNDDVDYEQYESFICSAESVRDALNMIPGDYKTVLVAAQVDGCRDYHKDTDKPAFNFKWNEHGNLIKHVTSKAWQKGDTFDAPNFVAVDEWEVVESPQWPHNKGDLYVEHLGTSVDTEARFLLVTDTFE